MNREEELKYLNNAVAIVSKIMNNLVGRISEIEKEITEEMRNNCTHDFQYFGHGHSDDCYICSKCQLSEWR